MSELPNCDCCGKPAKLKQCWVNGMETWACAECRDDDDGAYDERTATLTQPRDTTEAE